MLGIMQGRLSPPIDGRIQAFPANGWREELDRCHALGLTCLEWVFERPNLERNPLTSLEGAAEIRRESTRTGVRINSVVADYFMEVRLFGDDREEVAAARAMLDTLIERCAAVGIPVVELPFVDQAALHTGHDMDQVLENLRRPLERAADLGLLISLETSLAPAPFAGLIRQAGHPALKVNYDMGNSASLGFDSTEEIAQLGPYIVNVHIKDRVRGSGTVPLGRGDTDFPAVFAALRAAGYSGDFILQAARRDVGANDVGEPFADTVRSYIEFVTPLLGPFGWKQP